MKYSFASLVLLTLIFGLSHSIPVTLYLDSLTGSDSNNCTDDFAACLTIRGIQEVLGAFVVTKKHFVIQIGPGEYVLEKSFVFYDSYCDLLDKEILFVGTSVSPVIRITAPKPGDWDFDRRAFFRMDQFNVTFQNLVITTDSDLDLIDTDLSSGIDAYFDTCGNAYIDWINVDFRNIEVYVKGALKHFTSARRVIGCRFETISITNPEFREGDVNQGALLSFPRSGTLEDTIFESIFVENFVAHAKDPYRLITVDIDLEDYFYTEPFVVRSVDFDGLSKEDVVGDELDDEKAVVFFILLCRFVIFDGVEYQNSEWLFLDATSVQTFTISDSTFLDNTVYFHNINTGDMQPRLLKIQSLEEVNILGTAFDSNHFSQRAPEMTLFRDFFVVEIVGMTDESLVVNKRHNFVIDGCSFRKNVIERFSGTLIHFPFHQSLPEYVIQLNNSIIVDNSASAITLGEPEDGSVGGKLSFFNTTIENNIHKTASVWKDPLNANLPEEIEELPFFAAINVDLGVTTDVTIFFDVDCVVRNNFFVYNVKMEFFEFNAECSIEMNILCLEYTAHGEESDLADGRYSEYEMAFFPNIEGNIDICAGSDDIMCDDVMYYEIFLSSMIALAISVPVILVLLGFCVAVIIMCLCAVSSRKLKTKINEFKGIDDIELLLEESKVKEDAPKIQIDTKLFSIEIGDVTVKKKIAQGGGSAVVYLAMWKSQKVAFKVFQIEDYSDNKWSEFENEVRVLASVHFPFILQFFGACLDRTRLGFIMEWCNLGDLRNFLINYDVDNGKKYHMTGKLRILSEISSSMAYLHSLKIMHRDLKCENVLIAANRSSRVMDFGFSKLDFDDKTKTVRVGTNLYIAPEVVSGGKYDEKCDVFSFAMLFYIVITEKWNPFNTRSLFGIESKIAADKQYRPKISDIEISKDLKKLIVDSWSGDPKDRLSFEKITEVLKAKLKERHYKEDKPKEVMEVAVQEYNEMKQTIATMKAEIVKLKRKLSGKKLKRKLSGKK